MFLIEISELAETEILMAYQYYENESKGLGNRMINEIDEIIKLLEIYPFLFQKKHKHYREAILNKFPYFIVYEIKKDKVILLSFFHTSRNPKSKKRFFKLKISISLFKFP